MTDETQIVELTIPSVLGYEKMAMKLVVTVAQKMGFAPERVEDLKTAVSEACLNAIEHGNQLDDGLSVLVRFGIDADRLSVDVQDEGLGGPPPKYVPEPDINLKVMGQEALRQMGLYVIQRLVDEAGFIEPESGDGNQFRMVVYLD